MALGSPPSLLLYRLSLRSTSILRKVTSVADYLTLSVVYIWVVSFARLVDHPWLNMASWLNLTARLHVTGFYVGRDVRCSRDEGVVKIRPRGVSCLVRLLADREELFVDGSSGILLLDKRRFARGRLW